MSPVYFRSSAVIHHDNVNSSLNFPWLQKFWVQYLLLHLVVVSISLRIAEGEILLLIGSICSVSYRGGVPFLQFLFIYVVMICVRTSFPSHSVQFVHECAV